MRYLLDSCVISELTKRTPNESVTGWLARQDSRSLFLSVISIGEIKKGIAKRGDDARARVLTAWLEKRILVAFAERIIPVDNAIALEWGRICGAAETQGRKRPAVDTLLVATAAVHGMTLVTRNVRDMSDLGVEIVNPFA